jgi:hypothetical protein
MSGAVKKVYVRCHEPIAACKDAQQGWSDCYLQFKVRRKTVYKGPTFRSRGDVLAEVELSKKMLAKHESGESLSLEICKALDMEVPSAESMAAATRESLAEESALLAELDGSSGILVKRKDEGCPDVYTSKDWIDRAEAERMITALMAEYGVTSFRQKWKHPGGFLIHPVTL